MEAKNGSKSDSVDSRYMPELMAEKDSIDSSFVHAGRLLQEEIDKVKNPQKNSTDPQKFRNVMKDEIIKIEEDIIVPVKEFPKINFVGRLIGPGGSTMKGIQELSNTKIGVLGRGSVRAKRGEELNKDDPKLAHLEMPLHVHISAMGTLANVYYNMSVAVTEIQKLLQMDDDTAVQFAVAQGMAIPPNRQQPQQGGGTRGGANSRRPPRGSPMQRSSGAPSGNGMTPRGRGSISRGASAAGSVGGRGARGGATRGMQQRGAGSSRGRGMAGRGRGVSAAAPSYAAPKPQLSAFAAEDYGYEYGAAGDYQEAYEPTAYEAAAAAVYSEEPYDDAAYAMEASAYEYGYGQELGGYGGSVQSAASKPSFGQKPFRGKAPRGAFGRGRGMGKPY